MPHNHLPKEDWCLPGCQQPPGQGTENPSKAQSGQATLTDLGVVTCLVLSPTEGRVRGAARITWQGCQWPTMVMGEEGWMQRAGGMQGRAELSPPTPSSCSADGHSPGKQASEHSLLSSAFTCAMPTSLLLSHLRPRKAPVLGPGRELRQLTPRPGWGSTSPF